jgi:hypothetical protein
MLAGDFHLVPKAGAGLRLEAKRIGEKQTTPNGYQAIFQISDAYFHDGEKTRIAQIPNSISWLLLSTMEDDCCVGEDEIVQSFISRGGVTRAQLVLRTAVGFSLDEDQRIHWKAVGNNLDSILTCRVLLSDAQACFGSFVQYVFHQRPLNMPSFIPEAWQHPHKRS